MNIERNLCVKEILKVIEFGTLPIEETKRRLEELVDYEITRKDAPANIELITACDDLLWELKTEGKIVFESHFNENLKIVKDKVFSRKHISHLNMHRAKRCLIVAATILFCIGLLGGYEWLNGTSSPDEQQFVISGETVDVDIISKCIASHNDFTEFRTTKWEEVVTFLGFEPANLEDVLHDWSIYEYVISVTPVEISFTARFLHDTNKENHLVFNTNYYSIAEDAHWTFEQNKEGTESIIHGEKVYISKNIDRNTAMWIDGNILSKVSCDLSKDKLLHITSLLLGEK